MAEMEYQISSDELVTPHIPSSRWRQTQTTGVATIVFPLTAAAVHDTTYQATETAIEDTETLDSEFDTAFAKDFSKAKCCMATGYTCIKAVAAKPTCVRTYVKGRPCTELSEKMTFDTHDHKKNSSASVCTRRTLVAVGQHVTRLKSMAM